MKGRDNKREILLHDKNWISNHVKKLLHKFTNSVEIQILDAASVHGA